MRPRLLIGAVAVAFVLAVATAFTLLAFSVQAQDKAIYAAKEQLMYAPGWEGCPAIGKEVLTELQTKILPPNHINFVMAWNACQQHVGVPDLDRMAYENAMKALNSRH